MYFHCSQNSCTSKANVLPIFADGHGLWQWITWGVLWFGEIHQGKQIKNKQKMKGGGGAEWPYTQTKKKGGGGGGGRVASLYLRGLGHHVAGLVLRYPIENGEEGGGG